MKRLSLKSLSPNNGARLENLGQQTVFLQIQTDMMSKQELEQKEFMLERSKNLYLRGRDILLYGLKKKNPYLLQQLKERKYKEALAPFTKKDVPTLYWTTAGWVGAFGVDPFDMKLGLTLPQAAAMMERVTQLDPGFSRGAVQNYWRADDGDRPYFHPVDAGLPLVSLLNYLEIADEAAQKKVLDAVKRSLTFEIAVSEEVANPFGYSRQLVQSKNGSRRTSFFFLHDTETAPWWQGENARLGSMAAAARLASRYFAQDKNFSGRLQVFARDQLNWILGLNPFDSCMLHGKGRNNPAYMFFDAYEYTNAQGGICNGITAGYTDEEDIDFNLHFAQTGKDDDWRWAEQWLPHAAWFLFAVSLGED